MFTLFSPKTWFHNWTFLSCFHLRHYDWEGCPLGLPCPGLYPTCLLTAASGCSSCHLPETGTNPAMTFAVKQAGLCCQASSLPAPHPCPVLCQATSLAAICCCCCFCHAGRSYELPEVAPEEAVKNEARGEKVVGKLPVISDSYLEL